MKSLHDQSAREELISRINSLSENSTAQWGKMNLYQMLKHCCLAEESFLGKKIYPRVFLGRIFGQMAIKNMLKDERPISRNAKTKADFIVTGNGDYRAEKDKWISLIREYEHYHGDGINHWFFGRMNKEEVGQFAYKHADHHLRQFNA